MPSDERKTGMPADQSSAPKSGKPDRSSEQQVDELSRKSVDPEQADAVKGGLMPIRREP
ncbi:MAG TPA: hypothetical protein VKA84_15550 [Gemmatimonadaceae bacterium]|nr:hypothetical protein [Gemmatimonadaceae bacterium]